MALPIPRRLRTSAKLASMGSSGTPVVGRSASAAGWNRQSKAQAHRLATVTANSSTGTAATRSAATRARATAAATPGASVASTRTVARSSGSTAPVQQSLFGDVVGSSSGGRVPRQQQLPLWVKDANGKLDVPGGRIPEMHKPKPSQQRLDFDAAKKAKGKPAAQQGSLFNDDLSVNAAAVGGGSKTGKKMGRFGKATGWWNEQSKMNKRGMYGAAGIGAMYLGSRNDGRNGMYSRGPDYSMFT